MKKYYKLHVAYPVPLSDETIIEINNYLPEYLRGRIEVDEDNYQVGTITICINKEEGHIDSELDDLLNALNNTDCGVFCGYPHYFICGSEYSNEMGGNGDFDLWDMLDECEVEMKNEK